MRKNTTCPNDESLIDYLELRLSVKAREKVERHLTSCADCREQVAVCADLLEAGFVEESIAVPPGVTQRAVDAVLGLKKESLLDRLTQGIRDKMEKGAAVMERLTFQPAPLAVALRGQTEPGGPEVIHREKHFGDLQVEIEIEKSATGQATIRITCTSQPADAAPIRVALLRQDREVASARLEAAPVTFEEMPLGIYTLVFVQQRTELGHYAFEIAEHSD